MKIKSIKKIDYYDSVYNLRIKSINDNNHNYIANRINVANCHKIKTASIKTILEKVPGQRRMGLSGTIPKSGTLDRLTLMAYTGPVIQKIKASKLMEDGYIAPCEIRIVEMNYASLEVRESFKILVKKEEDRKKLLNLEQNYAIQSKKRLAFITDTILKGSKNSLVLFYRVEYGRSIYNTLRQKSNRDIYYIDGGVDADLREHYKREMEIGQGKILVASFGTFSTGINIKNLHTVFLIESFKSEIIIRQSIGRGLRKHELKDKLLIVDFVDDYRLPGFTNFMYRHSIKRREIYKEEEFPYKVLKVNLNDMYKNIIQ